MGVHSAATKLLPSHLAPTSMMAGNVTQLVIDTVDRLRGAGIEIAQEHWDTEAGSFARVHDPEGNPIELWEPPAKG